jgi:sugar lactone lactonase YvrE
MAIRIERIGTTSDKLGEGPVWDVSERALYWVDGTDGEIWRWQPGTNALRHWTLPGRIGSMALRRSGGAIVAIDQRLEIFDFDSGKCTPIAGPDQDLPPTYVFNDGKVDARGRFIVGTFSPEELSSKGAIFNVHADQCALLDTGFVCANGPAFSPDGGTIYVADTIAEKIFAYDYDLETGSVSRRRLFADTSTVGRPDGFTVDAEGCLWVAIVMAGKLASFNPAGKLEGIIEVPPTLPSSVMFGGDRLETLYVTSIGNGAGFGWRCNESDGGLFAVHGLGVTGRPEPRFGS